MSYKYRRAKRELAHDLLKLLSAQTITESTLKETIRNSGFYHKKVYRFFDLVTLKNNITREYDFETLSQAIRMLELNKHIYGPGEIKTNDKKYACTSAGEDAYLEEFYYTENRRDYLEEWELRSKMWLPMLAIAISLLALIVTIFKPDKNTSMQYQPPTFQQLPK